MLRGCEFVSIFYLRRKARMIKILLSFMFLFSSPILGHADCIDRGLDGVKVVFDFLYEEMGEPEPTEDNMEDLKHALFLRDRDAEPKIDNDITVSYSESEGGIDGGVSCLIDDSVVAQPFRWEPDKDLILEDRYYP